MRKNQINLLSNNKFNSTTLGKISQWSMSVGRWIVVVTELIVLIALFSRFHLDRKKADLIEEISHKKPVLEAGVTEEQQIRDLQKKLNVIKQVLQKQYDYDQILAELGRARPQGVYFTSLSISNQKIYVRGSAQTESSIAGMEYQLSHSPFFKWVQLSRIEQKIKETTPSDIQFEFTAQIDS